MSQQDIEVATKRRKGFFKFSDDQVQKKEDEEEEEEGGEKDPLSGSFFKILSQFVLQFLITILIVYPYFFIYNTVMVCIRIFTVWFNKDQKVTTHLLDPILKVILSGCMILLTVKCFIDFNENPIYVLWYYNAFALFVSQMFIYTYIKIIKNKDTVSFKEFIAQQFEPYNQYVILFNFRDEQTPWVFDLDLQESKSKKNPWKKQYIECCKRVYDVSLSSQRFNTLLSKVENPLLAQFVGFQLIDEQNKDLSMLNGLWLSLTYISIFKILACVFLIFQQGHLQLVDLTSVLMVMFFYMNVSYCLSKILSNYDLRRKTLLLKNLNKSIQLIVKASVEYFDKVDITSAQSMETWDNARRFIYDLYSIMQTRLEFCYIFLFFSYMFCFLVCFTAFGEIYVLIAKESIFLKPLMVISSSMDFIYLNVLIMNRLYYGQQYNDTFGELEESIDSLLGITQDLMSMYDYYFTKKNVTEEFYIAFQQLRKIEEEEKNAAAEGQGEAAPEDQNQESSEAIKTDVEIPDHQQSIDEEVEQKSKLSSVGQEYATCYDIIVSKIQYTSLYYVNQGEEFLGQTYHKRDIKILHQKILENNYKSFIRIKEQIKVDSKIKNYKIFNLIELSFRDTLNTILLFVVTVLPNAITKIIDLFTIESDKKDK